MAGLAFSQFGLILLHGSWSEDFMSWFGWLFSRNGRRSESDYTVAFELYNKNAKRGAQVRIYRDGRAYFVDREWVEGTTFKDRSGSALNGPYDTPVEAEKAAVSRPWFYGE